MRLGSTILRVLILFWLYFIGISSIGKAQNDSADYTKRAQTELYEGNYDAMAELKTIGSN